MNLYIVYPRNGDWSCYVFGETRNMARARLVGYFDEDNEYIDFGAQCVMKNVGGKPEVCEADCERLAELGVHYKNEEDCG